MTKQSSHQRLSTRAVLVAAVAITNVMSFVVGLSASGHIAITRKAPAAPAAARLKAKKPVARPLAAAARAGAVAGREAATPALPIEGKGMWIYEFNKIASGNARAIVNAAVSRGLTHLYVRAGSSVAGLSGWRNIAKILPVAHHAGLKVIAWDFPYLRNPGADVRRAGWVMRQKLYGVHSVDGFAADIETRAEGTVLTRARARRYATWLRAIAPGKFLILVPPRPNRFTTKFYPYDLLVPKFDAVAPMVYWGRQASDEAARWAVGYLKQFGKPIVPIGQAYDMGPEGGPKGPPSNFAVVRFMHESKAKGAVGVSFWSWQHTPPRIWNAIRSYPWPKRPERA